MAFLTTFILLHSHLLSLFSFSLFFFHNRSHLTMDASPFFSLLTIIRFRCALILTIFFFLFNSFNFFFLFFLFNIIDSCCPTYRCLPSSISFGFLQFEQKLMLIFFMFWEPLLHPFFFFNKIKIISLTLVNQRKEGSISHYQNGDDWISLVFLFFFLSLILRFKGWVFPLFFYCLCVLGPNIMCKGKWKLSVVLVGC